MLGIILYIRSFIVDPEIFEEQAPLIEEPTTLRVVNQSRNSRFCHLRVIGLSYFEHMKIAMRYAWLSFKASVYFTCHAIWPDSFQSSGSDIITELHEQAIKRRDA